MVDAGQNPAGPLGQDAAQSNNRRRFEQIKPILYPPLGITLTVLAWHLACEHFQIPTAVLPKPGQVLAATIARADLLWSEGIVTLAETVYGFLLALALGVPIAVAITSSRTLNLMVYPILIALQSVPKVALAPILLVWLGIGIESKLAIAWLVAFFPIVVDTAAGLQSTPPALIELARSLKANWWQIFIKVKLPAALPFIITGSKVAVTLAVIGAVIGEFVGSSSGLGYLLLTATSQLDTPLAFAALFALAALGILVYLAVVVAEWLLAPLLPHKARHD
jgi:NitT/TauT family transport system permease protein